MGFGLYVGLARAAEFEELKFMEKIGAGEQCDEKERWERLGKVPTSTKLVRFNRGTAENPDPTCGVGYAGETSK